MPVVNECDPIHASVDAMPNAAHMRSGYWYKLVLPVLFRAPFCSPYIVHHHAHRYIMIAETAKKKNTEVRRKRSNKKDPGRQTEGNEIRNKKMEAVMRHIGELEPPPVHAFL